jgi:hypothetical protein
MPPISGRAAKPRARRSEPTDELGDRDGRRSRAHTLCVPARRAWPRLATMWLGSNERSFARVDVLISLRELEIDFLQRRSWKRQRSHSLRFRFETLKLIFSIHKAGFERSHDRPSARRARSAWCDSPLHGGERHPNHATGSRSNRPIGRGQGVDLKIITCIFISLRALESDNQVRYHVVCCMTGLDVTSTTGRVPSPSRSIAFGARRRLEMGSAGGFTSLWPGAVVASAGESPRARWRVAV